jgi:hypothetical protein
MVTHAFKRLALLVKHKPRNSNSLNGSFVVGDVHISPIRTHCFAQRSLQGSRSLDIEWTRRAIQIR